MEPNEPQSADQENIAPPSPVSDGENAEALKEPDSAAGEFVEISPPQPKQVRRRLTSEEYRRLLDRKIRRMYPWSVLLFLAACASTWFVGGPVYAAGVMGILLAHELGHYFQALRYNVPASPPMFIPMPFLMLGTMGAVIVQGAGFANRKALFDIAISGPLAGLVFAIPIAWWGLQDSTVTTIDPTQGSIIFGDPLILKWMYEARHGVLAANQEVVLNPLLFAGWGGIFIGRKAHWVAYSVVGGAIVWMVTTRDFSFILMIGLLYAFGLRHPPTADDTVSLGAVRTLLGWLALGFVLIGFTPIPITAPQADPSAVTSPLETTIDSNPSIIPMRPMTESDKPH